MAQEIDNLSLDNFSIQNTMEMGAGDSQLLNDLMAPETSTSAPDEIEEIGKTVDPPKPTVPKPAKVTEIENEDDKDVVKKDFISSFLNGEGDELLGESEDLVTSTEDKQKDIPSEGNQYSALSNDLFNLGVFTKDDGGEDEEINTPEQFLERFNQEKQKGAIEVVNNFIGQFGEDYQKAFDAIFVKGASPKDYFNTLNNVTSFANLDLSQEKNQEIVMREALTSQGFEEEDVDAEIERLKNYGDLETTSSRHHKVLIKKEASKLEEIEQNAQRQLQQKHQLKVEYQTNVQNIIQEKLKTKGFDGIPLNPKVATELQEFLLVDKYKTASGETLTDFDKTILELKRPENHEMKVKLGLILKILEKDPTLSSIQKTGVTKESNQLFGTLAKQVTVEKNKKVPQTSSWFK